MTSGRRGLMAILAGTAGGQAIALLAAPLLSRVYSPADFGVLAIVSAGVAVLGTVAALRFDLAIPLPKDDREAFSLVALGLWSSLCVTVLGLVAVALVGERVSEILGAVGLGLWLWLGPVIAGAMGVYSVLNQLAIRARRYNSIARRNVAQGAATVVTQVTAGLGGMQPGGLVVGLGVGQLVSAITLGSGAGLNTPTARAGRSRARMRAAAVTYRRFPLMLAPAGLINVAGLQVPVVLIAYWYGAEVAGWLTMTQRVLSLPVMLVGTAVAQVYLGAISEAIRDRSTSAVAALFRRASWRLLLAGLGMGVGVALLAPWVFPRVFGSDWIMSGLYAQALAFSLAAQLVAAPLSQTLIVLGHQKVQLLWDLGRLLLTTSAVIASVHLGASPLVAVWSLGIATGLSYIVSWGLSARMVRLAEPTSPPES